MVKRTRLAKGWVRVKALYGRNPVVSDEIPAGMVEMFKCTHPELTYFEVVRSGSQVRSIK